MTALTLVIGNKRYSSWSLRPWLAMKQAGIAFEEIVVQLYAEDGAKEILRYSPSGRVPALIVDGLTIWESLAICEYVAERVPQAGLWPSDPAARAVARAVSCEMHAGFAALRGNMPMDVVADRRAEGRERLERPDVRADIARIQAIWSDCRRRFGAGGPFLFGSFSIADAMFAPVVTRFRTYGVPLEGDCAAYAEAVWSLPAMRSWVEDARAEPWALDV